MDSLFLVSIRYFDAIIAVNIKSQVLSAYMNKGRKAPKTPVKSASSPWWGNENHPAAGSAPPPSSSSGLDLSSLPKLGQQTPNQKPRSALPSAIQGPPGVAPGLSSAPAVPPGVSGGVPPGVSVGEIPSAPPGVHPGPPGPPGVSGPVPGVQAASSGPFFDHIIGPNSSVPSNPTPGSVNRLALHLPYLDSTLKPLQPFPQRQPVDDADRFGLKPLLRVLTADSAGTFSPAVGTEIAPLPQTSEQISRSFASPWTETSKHFIIPEYSLPECYNVQSVVPQQQKLQNLTEETLFYIFYTMPRDAMQEAVAVELTNRNWRYHKDLKLWLTKDPLSEPVQQNTQAESGVYVFFDPTSWEKVKKEYVLYYPDIA